MLVLNRTLEPLAGASIIKIGSMATLVGCSNVTDAPPFLLYEVKDVSTLSWHVASVL